MAATTTTVNDDIREALMGILDAQDGLICPGCGRVYFHLDDALSDDDDAQWDVDMHDDGCQVVEGIASIKAYREQQEVRTMNSKPIRYLDNGYITRDGRIARAYVTSRGEQREWVNYLCLVCNDHESSRRRGIERGNGDVRSRVNAWLAQHKHKGANDE